MSRLKKALSLMLAVAVAISGIQFAAPTKVSADAVSDWQNTAIVSPSNGKLVGAGYIDIKWKSDLNNAKSYTLYLDGSELTTYNASSSTTMSYEYYSTSVVGHETYVVATLNDNSTVTSNKSTFYVTKKGIGVNQEMGGNLNASSLNLGWYYNWGYESFAENKNIKNTSYNNIEYVPMIWGSGNNKTLAFEKAQKNGYKYMLGYNEPDLREQSNMSVNTVIQRWSDFSNSSFRVGSPVTATPPCWSSTWFKPFMKQINANNNLRVDFIAVHCYWETDLGSKKAALKFLEAMDETYALYHKPIWITEFAVAGKNHFSAGDAKAEQNVYDFMKVVLEGLNDRSYVERYAWFTFNTRNVNGQKVGTEAGASGLWDFYTGELTNLGKLYADMGNPAGYNGTNFGTYTSRSGVNSSAAACAAAVSTTLHIAKSTKKKTVKLTVQVPDNAKGYQVQYSKYKNLKKSKKKTIKKSTSKKVTTLTIKNLKRKKKYYVRVRAYKMMDGKKLYCAWSKKKSVKVK